MTLFHFISMFVGLGNLLIFCFIISFQSPRFLVLGQCYQLHFNVTTMFKRSYSVCICYNIHKPSFHLYGSWSSSMWTSFWSFFLKSSYLFCVVDRGYIKVLMWQVALYWHQLIIQEVHLETSLSTLVLANINGNFPHSRWYIYIIDLRPKYFVWCSTSNHLFTPYGL